MKETPTEPNKNYWILAYYHFSPIADPHAEVKTHKDFFLRKDVTCRIYISEEGINGQMSGIKEEALANTLKVMTRKFTIVF